MKRQELFLLRLCYLAVRYNDLIYIGVPLPWDPPPTTAGTILINK